MVLTSFNGHPAVKCQSVRAAEQVVDLLLDYGYAVRVKIIKEKPRRYRRHFLVFAYRPARSTQDGSTEEAPAFT